MIINFLFFKFDSILFIYSTIWPLKFASDYRPFFTIHNSEFQEYASKTNSPPSVIIGVTNPFFIKTLQHWPHVIKIGDLKSDVEGKKRKTGFFYLSK